MDTTFGRILSFVTSVMYTSAVGIFQAVTMSCSNVVITFQRSGTQVQDVGYLAVFASY
jgi:hypothetical protein